MRHGQRLRNNHYINSGMPLVRLGGSVVATIKSPIRSADVMSDAPPDHEAVTHSVLRTSPGAVAVSMTIRFNDGSIQRFTAARQPGMSLSLVR